MILSNALAKSIAQMFTVLYIPVTDEASDFKFGTQLGFAKAHHLIPLEEKWMWPRARGAHRN